MSGPGAHVVVVSDRAARGQRPDESGPALIEELRRQGYEVSAGGLSLVPDDERALRERIMELVADPAVRFVVTTGGTGVGPRDVTPEVTRAVVTRELVGFGELMRMRSLERTALAAASRATAGTRGDTLIVNLPGSPRGARECLEFVREPARHVVDLIAGGIADCSTP